jgi:hypothetical protein
MKEEEAEEEMTKHEESSACADDFPDICSSHFALSLYMSERETSESLCSQFSVSNVVTF